MEKQKYKVYVALKKLDLSTEAFFERMNKNTDPLDSIKNWEREISNSLDCEAISLTFLVECIDSQRLLAKEIRDAGFSVTRITEDYL